MQVDIRNCVAFHEKNCMTPKIRYYRRQEKKLAAVVLAVVANVKILSCV